MEEIESVVKAIIEANSVHIFGAGYSEVLAIDLQHKLSHLGISAKAYTEAHMQCLCAVHAKKEDILIIINSSEISKYVIENISYAKKNGVKILSLAELESSPLSKLADINLYTHSVGTKHQKVSTSNNLSAITIIDLIYTLIVIEIKETITLELKKALKKFEDRAKRPT